MTYRSDRLTASQREAIAARLVAAEHGLLGAVGTLLGLRREIERGVRRTGQHGAGFPSVSALLRGLTEAQALVHEAHGERVAVDALLERPGAAAATPMLPDPPRLGHAPPPDEASRRWWPFPWQLGVVLGWHLRYRPWWSTLRLAEAVVRGEREALRERDRELFERSDAHDRRRVLPPLDDRPQSSKIPS